MPSSNIPLIILTFLIVTLLFKITLSIIVEKKRYDKRFKKYIPQLEKVDVDQQETAVRRDSIIKKIAAGIEKIFNLSKHEELVLQSGIKLSLGEIFIARLMTATICILAGYLRDSHIITIVIWGLIGYNLPVIYIKNLRKKRLQKCSEQLGTALGTMANALRAGFSFMQAMKMVAEEIDDPLGPEFIKALQDINLGVTMEDAFESLLKRLPDKELEIVLNTLLIQRTSGGNLAYLMETMQETIINRSRVKDEVKTLTAQGRMSSVIITLLPIALALYIKFINPEYFQMLFSHPLGWAMVIFGSISILLGWVFIKKIVHIEV